MVALSKSIIVLYKEALSKSIIAFCKEKEEVKKEYKCVRVVVEGVSARRLTLTLGWLLGSTNQRSALQQPITTLPSSSITANHNTLFILHNSQSQYCLHPP